MNQLAFYAPLKSPDHPVPSGDREMARSIMAALSMNSLDIEVVLASQLRCYDGQGDALTQQEIRSQANAEVERLLDSKQKWCAWVTYHNYYKAPDLVGAAVSKRLNIPYFIVEASIAKSRLSGPWSGFAASADNATNAADVVFYLTEKDRVALEQNHPEKQKLIHLAPFLKQTELPVLIKARKVNKQLLSVGMHRYGDKLESYRIIADALAHLTTPDWQLSIIGDGPARTEIELMFAAYGKQVKFFGQLDRSAVNAAYQQASLFVWPGVNEAFGLVYLEAQAAGLPVVAQDRAGVREVISPAQSLVPIGDSACANPESGDPGLIARAIDDTLADSSRYQSMVIDGREFVRRRHLLGAAARILSDELSKRVS